MAFCQSCGNPLPENAAFCAHCGTRTADFASTPAAPNDPYSTNQYAAPPPPYAAAPPYSAPPAKKTNWTKILLIGGGILALVGIIIVSGLVYAGMQLKKKVENVIAENGAAPAASSAPVRRVDNVCDLLSVSEAASLSGLNIVRAESGSDSCTYFTDATTSGPTAEERLKAAAEKADRSQSPEEAQRAAEELAKAITSGAAGNGMAFQVKVNWEGAQTAETAYRFAQKAMANSAGVKFDAEVSGVGDRAYMAPMNSMLFVRRGDAWIEFDYRVFRAHREQEEAIARQVVSRL